MRRNSKWGVSGRDKRRHRKRSNENSRKGFWKEVVDAVWFQPYKPGSSLPMWRSIYRAERILKRIEQGQYQPLQQEQTWLGALRAQVLDVLGELADEFKALLTELAFHIFGLVLIVIFNVVWFWGLLKLIGRWLDG